MSSNRDIAPSLLPPTGRDTGLVSPCISVCEIDESSGFCKGCHRTRAEIRGWLRGTRLEQLDILSDLRLRRASLGLVSQRRVNKRKRRGSK